MPINNLQMSLHENLRKKILGSPGEVPLLGLNALNR
jgi:hypothetical protein